MKRQEYKISFEPTGRLQTPDEVPSATAPALRKRLIEQDAHVDFLLAHKTKMVARTDEEAHLSSEVKGQQEASRRVPGVQSIMLIF